MSASAKRALVTGGSAGLGAAMAYQLAASGFEVLSLDRQKGAIQTPDAGEGTISHLDCDLSSRTELDRILPELIKRGPFDLVVLNAGISATGRFEKIDLATHLNVLRVNTEAPMVITARLLEEGGFTPGAALLLVSSLSYFTGYPGAASYAASKDALAIYASSVRKAAKARGVSITVAFPGPLRTDHAERHAPQGADASKRMVPDLAARLILADALSRRKNSIPGAPNRAFALIGRIAPKPVTALMRRLIYLRLDP
ncbi:SDR family NAD(P)-dependent oxidoreductase [Hoeflea sp.]|uniref:SDR family NAD(P)-dependent oxidoreductase n=1 Tax=Hoeflea sp. TaxID=1940281 RepID=UPI003A8EFE2D